MQQVFAEAEQELETVLARFGDQPRAAVVQLLLLALEREEIVSMAYRQAQIADRLQRTSLPEDVRQLIEHAVIWIWKDEEMHAVYARGALMRLGDPWLRARAVGQQTGGILAGWAASVLHHAGWGRAPLALLLARLITLSGRIAGKVPREVGRQLRFLPFRDFCLLNAELEKASWMAWDRLALLAESQHMMPEMIQDFHRVAQDEIQHLRVFEAIAVGLTADDGLASSETAEALAARIAAVGPRFLPYARRNVDVTQQPIGSGGTVFALQGTADIQAASALRQLLDQADVAGALRRRAESRGVPIEQLRVVVKTCFMLGYHRRDPSPITDPELIRELVGFLREQGCVDIAVAESCNIYDRFFEHRAVREVAQYFGLDRAGGRIVDLSEEQDRHVYTRGMGQTTVAATWRAADFRLSFGKVRSHPIEVALLSLGNLEGVGGRSDQFLFNERQADRATALMMVLDDFPPHFSLLDCFVDVPDGLVGMMGCPRPQQPRRLYAAADPLALDCVVARHLGVAHPEEASLLRSACHWFGGWPEPIEVVGCDQPIRGWRGPYGNAWHALLSLLAWPVYVWGSGRGALFVPQMDPQAFPPVRPPGIALRFKRWLVRRLLGLRLPHG
jgi:uncharacterized protein (DUF362 family)